MAMTVVAVLASIAAVPAADPTPRHWAFDPPRYVAIPSVKDVTWPRTPIDNFILSALEAKGLKPAPAVDRYTLLRRVTFDLTGLPPTPPEIEAFLADRSDRAFETVVDRLLASPVYGERWGKHWLDVARYADSNGLDENIAHGNAWRFRDYVVAAFNADKPYDQFLTEQIAGDLLPITDEAERRQRLIATGFLSLGPKVLAEPDEKKMEMDIVDEQVDTVGRAFMGMTLGCARCHDHKFDPISSQDYYALAGVFVSTRTMENFKKVARWHEHWLATPEHLAKKAEHDRKVAEVTAKIAAATSAAFEEKATDADRSKTRDMLKKHVRDLEALVKAAPEIPSAMGVAEATVMDVPVLRRGNPLTPGAIVARRFPTVLAGDSQPPLPADHSGRLDLARWLTRADHPLTGRVLINRVWRWHFGRGLVGSVDNFGFLGEKPSHPELLDWLARRFVNDGWSVKRLHRLIVTSATYRMSSASDAAADADNRMLGRAPVRRLEAESIRDAVLAVSGLLDPTRGGPAITHVKNREWLFDHTSKDGTSYGSRRRSLYLPVVRNNLYDVFQLFDAADPAVGTGDRATTTVPTQALFLLNGGLVVDAAEALANRLVKNGQDDVSRARALYLTALGRPATGHDVDRILKAVSGFEDELTGIDAPARRLRAWALVCHAIFASNEFVYVN